MVALRSTLLHIAKLIASLACFVLLTGINGHNRSAEYQVKASFLYNLMQFVSFPESALNPEGEVNLCIIGENRFKRSLGELDQSNTPQGKIKVYTMGHFESKLNYRQCHVVYIVETEAPNIKQIMEKLDNHNTLTISEISSFIHAGGLIEIFISDDSIRFRINSKLAQEANYQIAAQLIALGVQQ